MFMCDSHFILKVMIKAKYHFIVSLEQKTEAQREVKNLWRMWGLNTGLHFGVLLFPPSELVLLLTGLSLQVVSGGDPPFVSSTHGPGFCASLACQAYTSIPQVQGLWEAELVF